MRHSRRSPSPRRRSRSRSRDRRSRSSRGSARRSRTRERSEYRSMTRSRSRSREKYRKSRSRVSISSSSSGSRSVSPRQGRDRKLNSSGWLESAGYGRMTPPPAPSLNSAPPPPPSLSSSPPPAPSISSKPPPAPSINSAPPAKSPAPPPPGVIEPGPSSTSTYESRPIPSLGGQANPSRHPNFGNNFQGNYSNFNSATFYPDVERPFGFDDPNNFKAQVPPGFGVPPPMPVNAGPPNSNWINPVPNYPQTNFPPPPTGGNPPPAAFNALPQPTAEAAKPNAVEQELIQQKKTFAAQREGFFKRKIAMTRELASLREQKSLIQKSDSKGADKILRENAKLQDEILQKLKSMDSVIEMLTHMIGDKEQIADLLAETSYSVESPKTPEKPPKKEKKRRSHSRSRSRSKTPKKEKKKKEKKSEKKRSRSRSRSPPMAKVNVVHYDPELHWCSTCNVFPRSAVAYLTHLHSDQHKKAISGKKDKDKSEEELMPWRAHQPREPTPPVFKDAPSRRVPIRGVPFLSAATAWYCSLCKMWLGDLELVNKHLRGKIHSDSYTDYVTQNPHWEVDWLRDRTRAYERNSEARTAQKEESTNSSKKKEKEAEEVGHLQDRLRELIAAAKDKEKRRHRSSSSSDSSSSDSSSDQSSDEKGKDSKKKEKDNKKSKDAGDKKKLEKKKNDKKPKTEKEPVKKEDTLARKWGRSRSRSNSRDRDSMRKAGFKGEHDWDRVRGFSGPRGGRGGRARVFFGKRTDLGRRLGPPAQGFYGPAEPPKKK